MAFVPKALMLKLILGSHKSNVGECLWDFFYFEQNHASFPEENHAAQFYIASRWGIKSFSVWSVVFEGNSFCLEKMLPRHLSTSSSNHLTGTCRSSFGVAVCVFESSAKVVQNSPKKLPSHIQQRAMNCAQMNQQMRHLSLIILSVLMSI